MLADGWLYASWVVGASRIRAVEGPWPNVEAKIHHSVGSWPVLLDDETKVEQSEPERLLRLMARTRPFGESLVELELVVLDGDRGTEIRMREDFVSGPGKAIPTAIRHRALAARNRESLRRLSYLAEGDSR